MVNLLNKYSFIDYIVLFGSQAREDNDAKSDYDISVIFSKDYKSYKYIDALLNIGTELSQLYRTDKIDLSCFNTSSLVLKHNIIADGKILFQNNAPSYDYNRIVYETNRAYFEFADFQIRNRSARLSNYKQENLRVQKLPNTLL